MATSRSCIKSLKSSSEVFHCICWLNYCNFYMKQAVSQRCTIKEVFWKTSQNSQINLRSSQPEVLCWKKLLLEILSNSQKNVFTRISFLIKFQAGNLKLSEPATEDVQRDKVVLKILQISHSSLFNKAAVLSAFNFIKKDSDTGTSLWKLRNFREQLFWRTSVNECF